MATDGVEIIDGDLARDTYGKIMDLYDSGVEIDTIKREVPFVQEEYGPDTDFYHEIFVTTYALAFWEIGEITSHMLDEVKRVIAFGAGVRIWNQEAGEAEGKKRQKELDKLLTKISAPNLKIRNRKKHNIVKNLYFERDDVLALQLASGNFHAFICAKVTQQRGQCTYDLVPTTYSADSKPTVSGVLDDFLLGHRIRSSFDHEETEVLQPGVTKIWDHTGTKKPFILGLAYLLVTHKDMVQLKDKFEKIGTLKIKQPFKKDGSYGYRSSFNEFEKFLTDIPKNIAGRKYEKFPLRLICDACD
jgi:hypothetical protein